MCLRSVYQSCAQPAARTLAHTEPRNILTRPVIAESGATVHFVDDRFETLKSVASKPALSGIKLYLVRQMLVFMINIFAQMEGHGKKGLCLLLQHQAFS